MSHRLICFLVESLLINQGAAQPIPKQEKILDRTEAFQRQFVSDFLKDGNLSDFVEGYPKTSDHFLDFRILLTNKEWVYPEVESRLREWFQNGEDNKSSIQNVSITIAFTGTITALDFIGRVFANRPEADSLIRMVVTTNLGSLEPNYFQVWYRALESEHSQVREIAYETISNLLKHHLVPYRYTLWAEAMIDRYNREPTTVDILRDPLFGIARINNPAHPEILHRELANAAKEAFAKRRKAKQ